MLSLVCVSASVFVFICLRLCLDADICICQMQYFILKIQNDLIFEKFSLSDFLSSSITKGSLHTCGRVAKSLDSCEKEPHQSKKDAL